MKSIDIRLPYKSTDKWTLVFAGDFHFGSRQCDEALIKKFVGKYKDAERTIIFFMGDEIDAITRTDKRFTPKCMHPRYVSEDNPIDLMIDDFVAIMMPLKGKIIAGADSNHNVTYRGVSGSDAHYRISKALGFERLGYGGWVNILWYFQRACGEVNGGRLSKIRTTSIHLTHGKPTGATTKAGKMTALERDAWYFGGDIMAHGHTHLLATPPANIYLDAIPGKGTYIKKKQRLLNTGSFLKSYSMDEHSPYSEVKRYPPIDMGWGMAEVEFRDSTPFITLMTKEY